MIRAGDRMRVVIKDNEPVKATITRSRRWWWDKKFDVPVDSEAVRAVTRTRYVS